MLSSRLNLLLLATSVFAINGGATVAQAQESSGDEVVVTGSRITRPGYTAPTPVTSVSTADLLARAPGNLNELQRDLPQLTVNENTNTNRGFPGSSNPNLRNLGASRTLVLLDGVRLTPSTPQGLLDVSSIPTALIQRIDLVTGGASAAYGSDAVAGVMSIFLDNRFEGVKATGQVGQSKYGDYQNYLLSSAIGTSFAGGRGHLVAAGEWYENLGVPRTGSRDWGKSRYGTVSNPAYVAGNTAGNTRLVLVPDVTLAHSTVGGVIVAVPGFSDIRNSPLKGIQFGANGAVLPFQYGQYFSPSSTFQAGVPGFSLAESINISAYQKRYGGMANAEYELTDNLTAFANGMWVSRKGILVAQPNYNANGTTAVTIRSDNPFIPQAVRTIMTANGITSFQMGRANIDAFNPDSSGNAYSTVVSTQESTRLVGGFKGEFGNGWTWDASATYGNTDFTQSVQNDRIEANWRNSIDAVLNPATGQAACRINVDAITTNDDPACVPVNLFGTDTVSIAAGKYSFRTSQAFGSYKRTGASANVQGDLFEMPAGPVALATGVEIRKDELNFDADPISKALGYRTNNQGASAGDYTVTEGYAETDVPLVKDAPLMTELSVNGAVRYTDYSTSGGVTTWKVGGNWKPSDDLRFRGVVSRDIRAPSLFELFAGVTQNVAAVVDGSRGTFNYNGRSGGNPNLKPEEGTTYSAGFVYQPGFLSGLQVSLDYYKIKLEGAIEATAAQSIVNFCNAGQTQFCGLITRNAAGNITTIDTTSQNTGSVDIKGWDFDTVYSLDAMGGTLTLHGVLNYTPSRITTTSGVRLENAGVLGTPKWRGNGTIGWRNDMWNLQAQYQYFSGAKRDATYIAGVDHNDIDVDGQSIVNLSASYDLREGIQLFGKVDNLLDAEPEINPATTIGQQQVANAIYDSIGQRWTTGVRFNF